jgi:ribosome-associated translation inhibitor RaiA
MKTLVQFRNFEGVDHLKQFVESSINQTVGKFESWRHFNIHVVLGMVKGRTDLQRPIFECELLINGRGLGRPIVVKKINSDFYQVVRSCLKATEKNLSKGFENARVP